MRNLDYATSEYDPTTSTWIETGVSELITLSKHSLITPLLTQRQNLNIPRGYQAQTLIADGRTFTIGAGWSGGVNNKNGEIYNSTTKTWSKLPGCLSLPLYTQDTASTFVLHDHMLNDDTNRVKHRTGIRMTTIPCFSRGKTTQSSKLGRRWL